MIQSTGIKIKTELQIPQELKDNDNWVVVRENKIPYQINRKKAKCNDNNTWNTYDNCLNAMNNDSNIKGLGYMLSMQDDYIIIDIDKININKEKKLKFVNKYNTYTELSQSGKGFHLIFKTDKKEFEKYAKDIDLINYNSKDTLSAKNNDFEIYIDKRYFWLTGNIIDNKSEIKYIEFEELEEIFESIYDKKISIVTGGEVKLSPELTNKEILELCLNAKNKDKFLNLYNEEGKQGNSETDLSLLCILAFYTQNVNQLIKLMKESPRYRDKFNRDDYLKRTAIKAINLLEGNYYKTNETDFGDIFDKFLATIKKQGAIIPDTLKKPFWIFDKINEKTGEVTYKIACPILAEFLIKNCDFIFIKYSMKGMINRFLYEDNYYKLVNDNEFKGFIAKYIPLFLQSTRTINEVMNLIYLKKQCISNTEVNPEQYINFKNGLFNIESWKMEEHTPKIYSTIQLQCKYIPDVKLKNSIFDKYMNDLTEGKEDIKKLLLQYVGLVLSNIPGGLLKKSLFMVGPGDTGKAQLKNVIEKIIGIENSAACDLGEIEKRFGTQGLFNKRLAGSNDMGFITIKELKLFKKLTGNDPIEFEFKGEGVFTDKYNGTLWFACNELPKFGGDKGEHVYNRIIVVNCDNVIPLEKQNKKLENDMLKEKEYIISKCMIGLKQVLKNNYNFNIPEQCQLNLEKYKIDNDSILSFLNECCIIEENNKKELTKPIIYKIYKKWCEDNNNNYSEGKMKFNQVLKNKNLGEIKTINGIRYYKNFTIKEDAIKEYYNDYL